MAGSVAGFTQPEAPNCLFTGLVGRCLGNLASSGFKHPALLSGEALVEGTTAQAGWGPGAVSQGPES